MPPLDLTRPRDLGALLATSLRLWLRHLPLFAALALVVVAPVLLLVDGLWGGTLDELAPDEVPVAPGLASMVLQATVVPALVTAMHVVAVQDLGRGLAPTFGRSTRRALAVLLPVAFVVAIYAVAIGLGFVALVIPGIWLSVHWYFGAQAAVVDGARGTGALRASGQLVEGRWWRTFGAMLALAVLGTVAAGLAGGLVGLVVGLVGAEAAGVVVGNVLVQTLVISWTALAGTLLFFDLRARRAPHPVFSGTPERPDLGPAPS